MKKDNASDNLFDLSKVSLVSKIPKTKVSFTVDALFERLNDLLKIENDPRQSYEGIEEANDRIENIRKEIFFRIEDIKKEIQAAQALNSMVKKHLDSLSPHKVGFSGLSLKKYDNETQYYIEIGYVKLIEELEIYEEQITDILQSLDQIDLPLNSLKYSKLFIARKDTGTHKSELISNAQYNLDKLRKYLIDEQIIDKNTSKVDFEAAFSSKPIGSFRKIVWLGLPRSSRKTGLNSLAYFICKLYEKNIIERPFKKTWITPSRVFVNRDGQSYLPEQLKKASSKLNALKLENVTYKTLDQAMLLLY